MLALLAPGVGMGGGGTPAAPAPTPAIVSTGVTGGGGGGGQPLKQPRYDWRKPPRDDKPRRYRFEISERFDGVDDVSEVRVLLHPQRSYRVEAALEMGDVRDASTVEFRYNEKRARIAAASQALILKEAL